LALPEITQEHILSKCITLDKNQYITLLGYSQGENIFTYAQYSKERAIDFFILLRHLADYVIVDCSSGFTGDVLSTVALEMADMVLRLGKANLKSVSYFNSYLPVLADRRFNTDRHIKVLSNVKVIEPREQVKELFGGVRYEIPHTEELEVQFLNGELFSGLTGKSSLEYNKSLETLTKMILREEIHDGKGKTKSIKDKNSEKPMKNGIFSSIKLWKGGKERE
jgi:MinD-like ATPase involved in chromosome partitioning or flagellar assembly